MIVNPFINSVQSCSLYPGDNVSYVFDSWEGNITTPPSTVRGVVKEVLWHEGQPPSRDELVRKYSKLRGVAAVALLTNGDLCPVDLYQCGLG